jgi:hypothetical protein
MGGRNVSYSKMIDFFAEQGRTRVYAETYFLYVAGKKPEENAAQRKNSHLWMDTIFKLNFSLEGDPT